MFYDIYAQLCADKGVSPSRAAVDMGFYRSSVSYWKNKGGSPGREGLLKMTEYFNVPLEVLTAPEKLGEPAVTPSQNLSKDNKGEQKSADIITEESEKAKPTAAVADSEPLAIPSLESQIDAECPEDSSFRAAIEHTKALEYVKPYTEQEIPLKLKDKIKLLRKQQGLTLEYVAKAVGVDKKTLQDWESGEIENIRKYKIWKLARLFGTTVDYLTGKENITAPDTVSEICDLKPFIDLLNSRGECLALLMLSRDMTREDIELTINFMRSLKATEKDI